MFRRAILVLALVLCAAGCDRRDASLPLAESRTPPDLPARFFPPEGWAWGYVQVGSHPPQRYGVAATWRAPRATIIILPDTGECAEAWFETANDLTRRSYSVWVLDRASECGSGRAGPPPDKIRIKSFDPDVSAVKALVRVVIRPGGETPIFLLGQGQGAILALNSAQAGLKIDGLILSSPSAPGSLAYRPWSRNLPDAYQRNLTHDPWRGHVAQSWMTANPDLRVSGADGDWTRLAREFSDRTRRSAQGLGRSTLILTPGPAAQGDLDLCGAIGACSLTPLPGARSALHLEADSWRAPWLRSVITFIAAKAEAARRVGKDRDEPAPVMTPSPLSDDLRPKDTLSGTDAEPGP